MSEKFIVQNIAVQTIELELTLPFYAKLEDSVFKFRKNSFIQIRKPKGFDGKKRPDNIMLLTYREAQLGQAVRMASGGGHFDLTQFVNQQPELEKIFNDWLIGVTNTFTFDALDPVVETKEA